MMDHFTHITLGTLPLPFVAKVEAYLRDLCVKGPTEIFPRRDSLRGMLYSANAGICGNMQWLIRREFFLEDEAAHDARYALLMSWCERQWCGWSKFSGNPDWPVPFYGKDPCEWYEATRGAQRWTGTYGDNRRELCGLLSGLIAKYLREVNYVPA
jgi:hypothetical protein